MDNKNNQDKIKTNDYKNLTNDQLLQEQKKLKTSNITKAVLIGLFISIAAYSTYNKGFGFFTVFPLFFARLLTRDRKKSVALEEELNTRDLK